MCCIQITRWPLMPPVMSLPEESGDAMVSLMPGCDLLLFYVTPL